MAARVHELNLDQTGKRLVRDPTRRSHANLGFDCYLAHNGRWTKGRTPEEVIGKVKVWPS
jgi:hypothetical protein